LGDEATQGDRQKQRLALTETSGVVEMRFPRGNVDGTAVREMLEAAASLTERHDVRLLVDFSGVQMVSSGAMGMLVTMRKKLMHVGGQMQIAVPDEQVMESFRVTKLHQLLNIQGSVEAARAAFKAHL
jgi:anti-sigma B factor antagonist